MLPLTGYADRFSVAPGETIAFKVSSALAGTYQARLVRVISGDPNPAGPGIRERDVPAPFAGSYPSRVQPVPLGSYARVPDAPALQGLTSFRAEAIIWPTTPAKGRQGIIAKRDDATGAGFALWIDARGAGASIGDGRGAAEVEVGKPLRERAWYRVSMAYDAASRHALGPAGAARSRLRRRRRRRGQREAVAARRAGHGGRALHRRAWAASPSAGTSTARSRPPRSSTGLPTTEAPRSRSAAARADVIAAWDFSRDVTSQRIVDAGPNVLHGELVNLPARGMKGARWTGEEMCWRHAPEHYAAIHFHDDDLYDCGWQTDFTYTVPADLPSGVYAARLACGGVEEMIPFFVRPPRGQARARACLLVPTFTYIVYANIARRVTNDAYRARVAAWGARPWTPDEHRDYGLSTYNFHTDGSGIAYSSRLRPIMTMRSGFLAYVDAWGSGVRHLPADTHLVAWLDAMGHEVDIVTDEDLHAEGLALLAPYKVVLTPSHPEYQSRETLDALSAYVARGGRLMYLGGNGFYWRVAVHPDVPGAVEIRRGEGGIRAWAAEPGEYYNAFDGSYGGLWRRNGRPPQQLVGVGFTSQAPFEGNWYRRAPGAADPRAAWILEGVRGDIIGDFGLSGGGAAGFELDRADHRLGTPPNTIVVASSEGHDLTRFALVPEEMLTDVTTWPGEPRDKLIRADMVYFEAPNGGAVFSVGSITFCGSLPHDNFDNDISRIVDNVLRRFRDT